MKADKKTYEKVAKNCSEYSPCEHCKTTNAVSEESCVSCLTCGHFDSNEHCNLNLYDKIVNKI